MSIMLVIQKANKKKSFFLRGGVDRKAVIQANKKKSFFLCGSVDRKANVFVAFGSDRMEPVAVCTSMRLFSVGYCSGLQGDSVSASCLLEAQPPHVAKSPIENNSDSPTTTREKGRRMNSLSSFIVVALNYQQQQ